MRIFSATFFVLLLFGVACAGPSWARGGGGGHVRAPIVITGPGRVNQGLPGAPAEMAVEVLDLPPTQTKGVLKPDSIIAWQTVRALDAIVLLTPVQQGAIDIPAGTVLAKVVTRNPANQALDGDITVWCSTRPLALFHTDRIDCLQDSLATGKLDRFWSGDLPGQQAPFLLATIESGPSIAPARYRPATVAERPTTQIGYKYCPGLGDGVSAPPRFTSVVQYSRGWIVPVAACPFGDWADSGNKGALTVDRLNVKFEASTKAIEVLNRIPPGPLAQLVPGQPFEGRNSVPAAIVRRVEALSSRPLIPQGTADHLAAGIISHGDTLLTVPVAHGVTGTLKYDAGVGGLLPMKVPAGQYVFGIPMHGGSGDAITWCAPRPVEGRPNEFSTVCFPPVGAGYGWVSAGSRLFVTSLYWRGGGRPDVPAISVDRTHGSLGAPMTLAYVFDHWDTWNLDQPRVPTAWIGVEMRVNGVMSPIDHIVLYADDHGLFHLPILGGVMTLSPTAGDGAVIPPPDRWAGRPALEAFFKKIDRNKAKIDWPEKPAAEGALPVKGFIHTEVTEPVGFLDPST